MATSRTPETLTAAQRARSLQKRDHNTLDLQAQDAMNASTLSPAQQKAVAQMRKTLAPAGKHQPNIAPQVDPLGEAEGSLSMLPIDAIVFYEHNPRQTKNPRYEELKASIQADGITNPITVTRRNVNAKYTPYGGGNTRLQIAKELYADGDQRFAQLRVVIKTWPGDAQVISAHLAENELRGEITFWEKATGIDSFRVELERESGGASLSAASLNRALKKRGLNYGVKTIQNFAFAVDHLRAIGPWLQARTVNEVLRPQLSAFLELMNKLGQGASAEAAINPVLGRYSQHLTDQAAANDGLPADEARPVEVDDAALIADIRQAVTAALQLTPEATERMLQVLEQQPQISADALREAATRTPAPPALPPTPAPNTAAHAEQVPLAGMLAGVRAPAATKPDGQQESTDDSRVTPAETDIHVPAQTGNSMIEILATLNGLVPLHDVLVSYSVLPFGYLVDFPPESLGRIEGEDIRSDWVPLRIALWKVLAALSYQYDRRVIARCTDESAADIRWVQSARAGRNTFVADFEAHIGPHRGAARYLLGMDELALVLGTPEVGDVVVRLMTQMKRVRERTPEDLPPGFEPLFDN